MKSVAELLNNFRREYPKVKITDVYDDDGEIMVRGLTNGRADFYFIKKTTGSIRLYYSRADVVRVSDIIQNNKKLNIQNEE